MLDHVSSWHSMLFCIWAKRWNIRVDCFVSLAFASLVIGVVCCSCAMLAGNRVYYRHFICTTWQAQQRHDSSWMRTLNSMRTHTQPVQSSMEMLAPNNKQYLCFSPPTKHIPKYSHFYENIKANQQEQQTNSIPKASSHPPNCPADSCHNNALRITTI